MLVIHALCVCWGGGNLCFIEDLVLWQYICTGSQNYDINDYGDLDLQIEF